MLLSACGVMSNSSAVSTKQDCPIYAYFSAFAVRDGLEIASLRLV
jgi:hypothetical protein